MSGTLIPARCILVLGMHRSGTSALTGALEALGAPPPPGELMGAAESNRSGHFEPLDVVDLNDRLLAALGSAWFDWRAVGNERQADFEAEAIALLRRWSAERALFTMKDPRICRLVPFWRDVLEAAGTTPLVLLPFRNPLDVAASLEARDGLPVHAGLHLWLRHMLDAEAETRHVPRTFVRYERFLAAWQEEATRISAQLDFTWPVPPAAAAARIESFLRPDERHQASGDDVLRRDERLPEQLRAELIAALEAFEALCAVPDDPGVEAKLDRLRNDFEKRTGPEAGFFFDYTHRLLDLRAAAAEAARMKSSKSWRLTAPLRAMDQAVQRRTGSKR